MEQIHATQDFYRYVNQQWLDDPRNAIPDEYSSWGGFVQLADSNLNKQIYLIKRLNDIYDSPNRYTLNEEQKKIVRIWKASNKRFAMWERDESDPTALIEEFKMLGRSLKPTTDHSYHVVNLAYYFYHTQINGLSNLLNFDKGSSPLDSNHVMMDIAPSGLSLPSREYYFDENFADTRMKFIDHLNRVRNLTNQILCATDQPLIGPDFAQNVMDFEKIIAMITMTSPHSRLHDKYYSIVPLEGVYEKLGSLKHLPEKLDQYHESDKNVELSDELIKMVKLFMNTVYDLFDIQSILRKNFDRSIACDRVFSQNIIKNNMKTTNRPADLWNQIVVYDGDYFRRVFQIMFDQNNYNKLVDYYRYQIIMNYQGIVSKQLNDEFFDFYSRKLNGQNKQKSNDKRSIQTVNNFAGEMMGKIFVDEYFPQASKDNINHMIDRILIVMKRSIEENDWLTAPTKEYAGKKLQKFVKKIGYPDHWKDYTKLVIEDQYNLYEIMCSANRWSLKQNFYDKINCPLDRSEWLMTPQTVNAYFMPPQNEIVFPAAILQPPFYHRLDRSDDMVITFNLVDELDILCELNRQILDPAKKIDSSIFLIAVNYGGIGAVIAHEITHGYDDQGSKYDADGNINNWWTEEDTRLFNEKTKLMEQQAEKYRFIDPETKNEYKMDAQLTMGENLADLGGMTLSLRAMHGLLAEMGMDHIKNLMTRVFFKSFANIWKQNIKKESLINRLTTDPHAPTDFRGNMVRNIDQFHEIFGTTPADRMWLEPHMRVRMW